MRRRMDQSIKKMYNLLITLIRRFAKNRNFIQLFNKMSHVNLSW
jgi:hypothetical protein